MDQNDLIPPAGAGGGRPDLTLDLSESELGSFPPVPDIALEREIGRGGNGVVYLGRQTYLDRTVAVKVINPAKIGSEGGRFTERFQREAKLLAGLNHPNIVACYQAGVTPDGECYLAMEYVEGHSLSDHIAAHGSLDSEIAARIALDTARALDFANTRGIIHRDVKPDNILLKTESGPGADPGFPYTVKLVDLGLAKMCDDGDAARMTQTGVVMGTPVTMAPEQFTDPEGVDFRADIYGLGCALYQCLTAVRAFPQRDIMAVMMAKSTGAVPDPSSLRPDLPPGLTALVKGLLAPKPADRPQTYTEVMALLAMFARGPAVGIAAGGSISEQMAKPSPTGTIDRAPVPREPAPTKSFPLWPMVAAAAAAAAVTAAVMFMPQGGTGAKRENPAPTPAVMVADALAAPSGRGLPGKPLARVAAIIKARRQAGVEPDATAPTEAAPAAKSPDFAVMKFTPEPVAAFAADPAQRLAGWTKSGAAIWTADSEGEVEGTLVFATEGKGLLIRTAPSGPFMAEVRLKNIDREAGLALLAEDGRVMALTVQNLGAGAYKAGARPGAVAANGTPDLKGASMFAPVPAPSDNPLVTLKVADGWVRGEVNGSELFTMPIGFDPDRLALLVTTAAGATATSFGDFKARAGAAR